MCAIIGYQDQDYNKDLVNKLILESSVRGLHAFGFATGEKVYRTLDLQDLIEKINEIKPKKCIIHCRYSTSGDYSVIENNQPLVLENNFFAFNGVISMKTKSEMEKEFNLLLPTDNDGYILMNNLENQEFLNKKNISFAGVGIKNNVMYALRNDFRPAWIYSQNKTKIVASTKDIMLRSKLDPLYIKLLPEKQLCLF